MSIRISVIAILLAAFLVPITHVANAEELQDAGKVKALFRQVKLLEQRVNELERQAKRQPLKTKKPARVQPAIKPPRAKPPLVKQPKVKPPVASLFAPLVVPKTVSPYRPSTKKPSQKPVKESPYLQGTLAQSLQNSRSMMLKQEMPIEIEGRWLMTLPGGYKYQVTIEKSDKGTFGMTPTALNSSGQYRMKKGILSIVEPTDKRLLGFQWTAVNPNVLVLTSQPKTEQTGANYLGATLTRLQED